jgi:RNA polymerase sigma factor (sigma-70 family)
MSSSCFRVADLYQNHAPALRKFVGRRMGYQETEDIVQDAYLHVLQSEAAATLQSPRAYLFKVAANLIIDEVRRSKVRYGQCDLECADFEVSSSVVSMEFSIEARRLQIALYELPKACRTAFLLSRIVGLSYPEIAGRLGVSVRTVDRYMIRAWTHVHKRTGRVLESRLDRLTGSPSSD